MDDPTSAGVPKARYHAFSPFLVDFGKRQLWHNDQKVALTAKTFDVLAFLLANRNRVVTKDEFFTHVWPNTIVLEANLVSQVSLLRRALGQRLGDNNFIVTIPGRGYQFVADVVELNALPEALIDKSPVTAAPTDAIPTSLGRSEPEVPSDNLNSEPRGAAAQGEFRSQPRTVRELYGRGAVAAALLVFCLSGALWLLPRPDAAAVPTKPTLQKFTFDAAFPREATWSPDGQSLAYVSDRSGNADIWVQSTGDPTPKRVTFGLDQDSQPQWSPRTNEIVFRSEMDGGGLFLVSAGGGAPTRLTSHGYGPKWSPDGQWVLFTDAAVRTGARRLFVVERNGGTPREITVEWMAKLRGLSWANAVNAAWYPDGRHISLWGRFEGQSPSFVTVDLKDGTSRVSQMSRAVQSDLDGLGLRLGNFAWSPSGDALYFEGRLQGSKSLWRVGVDPATKEWISGPERLTLGTTDDTNIALSPDGTKLAFTAQTSQTRVWSQPFDSSTGQLTGVAEPITPGNANELDVDVSEDGTQLAYRALRDGREEIWAYSFAERRARLLLTSSTARRTSPRWSPDGTKLLYARRTPGATLAHSLAVLPTLGGEERVMSIDGDMRIDPRDWSHDGRTIVGQCRNESMTTLATCLVSIDDATGKTEVRIIAESSTKNLFCQRFSPDQQWVSFLAIDPTNPSVSRVYIVSTSGGQWTAVTDGSSYEDKPRWAPDGRTLYFVSNRNGSLNVWGRHLDSSTGMPHSQPFRVTAYQSPRLRLSPELGQMEIAVTRDRLFLPISETTGAVWILDKLRPQG